MIVYRFSVSVDSFFYDIDDTEYGFDDAIKGHDDIDIYIYMISI